MDNLFLLAMDTDKFKAIEQTKQNKEFVMRLINDLRKVFHIYPKIEDEQNSSVILIKAREGYKYMNNRFIANADGVVFHFHSLGYYKTNNPHTKPLGQIYERYKDCGTVAEKSFLDNEVRNGHGYVHFRIPLVNGDISLNQALKDIVYLLEQDQYSKVF